jgi:hypothetical protein
MNQKWSQEYKKSIDCSNPKGFSQRAHCQGKKKKSLKELREYMGVTYGVGIGPVDTISPMDSLGGYQLFPQHRKNATMFANYKPMLSAQKIKTPAIKPDFRSTGEKNIKEKKKKD